MNKLTTALILPMMALVVGCTTDPVVPIEVISFSEKVQPIFLNNCASSGCHDGSEEFALETFDQILEHVKPGDPGESQVYNVITKLSGEEAMPPGGPLSDQQIHIIYTWILQGAKNN